MALRPVNKVGMPLCLFLHQGNIPNYLYIMIIMKAMQVESYGPLDSHPLVLRNRPVPNPSPQEILIRVHTCAVCHTDLHVIERELTPNKTPLIPGHQIVGIVERIGSSVTGPQIGTRVGVAWLHSACGSCEYCLRGEENLCPSARFTGYDVDGGYAEYVVAPAAFVYPIPDVFSDEAAAPLLCAGIIGFRALRLSNIKPGGRLGLFGFGASAHLAIQIARHWECDVCVFSRNEHHRSLARELGAAWTGTAEERPPFPLDSIISFAPAGDLVPTALAMLRKGGTLALAGIYVTPIPQFEYDLLYYERQIKSVANSTRHDGLDFLKIAAEIPVRTEVEVFPLDEANTVLQRLKASRLRGAGVLRVHNTKR